MLVKLPALLLERFNLLSRKRIRLAISKVGARIFQGDSLHVLLTAVKLQLIRIENNFAYPQSGVFGKQFHSAH